MGYLHSRDELLASAVDLALTRGIGALTFGSVGKHAGTSDRTVVYYFPSKSDLMTAVVGELGGQLQELLAAAFGDAPLEAADLRRRAWPILAAPTADPVLAVFFELVGLASARAEPYASLATGLIEGWLRWLEPRVAAATSGRRRKEALASVAVLDGLLLLRRVVGPAAAETAARQLGVSS